MALLTLVCASGNLYTSLLLDEKQKKYFIYLFLLLIYEFLLFFMTDSVGRGSFYKPDDLSLILENHMME